MNELMNQRVNELTDHLVAIRHDLHAHPQLAYKETYVAEVVCGELDRAGIAYQSGVATTGVVGWIGEGEGVALRADMDALPIAEQNDLPYVSQHPGCMHACGHDGHTTMLIGAAHVLAAMRDELPQPVKFIFQPAEEVEGGAQRMIEAGALDERIGPVKVTSIYGLHGAPQAPVGTVAGRAGAMMAATDHFDIRIAGKGGHAAFPHETIDPIACAAQLVTDLQSVVSQVVEPPEPAVLAITSFHAGNNYNVTPAEAALRGTARYVRDDAGAQLRQRLIDTADRTAVAAGCRAEVKWHSGYPVLNNDPAAFAVMNAAARAALGGEKFVEMPAPVMAAEDFAYYGHHARACFAFLGLRDPDRPDQADLHSPHFDFNDAAISHGVKLLCRLAMEIVCDK